MDNKRILRLTKHIYIVHTRSLATLNFLLPKPVLKGPFSALAPFIFNFIG